MTDADSSTALDSAYEKAVQISNECSKNLSAIKTEEDAKIQIINRMITECLGWQFSDIGAEVKHDNGYSDYLLHDTGSPALLIEAKRTGLISIERSRRDRLRRPKIAGPVMKSAIDGIDQAASYAAPNGLVIAVLTDGLMWVVFKTFIPGENFKNKPAFVFPTLDAILADFPTFYELLSKEQFRKKTYGPQFDVLHNSRLQLQKPLRAPLEGNEIRIVQKSEIAYDLERVFSAFFAKLTGDENEDLLINCFVETRESRIADFALEKITANVLGNLVSADKDVDKELEHLIEDAVDVQTGQTVFIVGPTGAGKSTFLDRFFRKTLSTSLRRRCVVLNVNCLDFSGRSDVALQWITESLITALEGQLYIDGVPSYDELHGLYHHEYARRAKGVDAYLYKRDKAEFREKFGTYLADVVEKDREGYLRRILSDAANNRGKLPILVVDNTDEFSLNNKEIFFQYAQALARHAKHCLLIFPVTDKSAWSFSKTDIFGIYQSRSFFLPTPPPREVFRKRIDFLNARLSDIDSKVKPKNYFTQRGINISIKNLSGFAEVLEHIFVAHDYTSRTIGELANYNIRRTLELSKRVITSAVFSIEDLLKSYFVGEIVAPNFAKFMNALMKGDYDVYKPGDCYEISPLFQISTQIRRSPLLPLRVLEFLESTRRGARTVDDRHVELSSIVQYFDGAGCTEVAVDDVLLELFEAGLVEPFDSSVRHLAPEQRLAISHSGRAHLRLATNNRVFFEQMALTTAICNDDVAAQIRSKYQEQCSYQDRMEQVRKLFLDYLIEEDRHHMQFQTELPQYSCQADMVGSLKALARSEPDSDSEVVAALGDEYRFGVFKEHAMATVDWFDQEKGFGFADVDGIEGGVFLHASKLDEAGIELVNDGDELLCDVAREAKGVSIAKVHDIQTNMENVEKVDSRVIRLYVERGYGFVTIGDDSRNAFFHISVVPQEFRDSIGVDSRLSVEVVPDKEGRGLQVRKVFSIDANPISG